MKDAFKDPNHKAALTPYHPNAIRNRLKVEFKDSAIPSVRFCHPRNEITYECAAGPAGTCGQGTSATGAKFFLTCTRWDHAPLTTCGRSFFSGSKEAGYQRFRTTSQNYYAYDTKALAVGESNQGIVSEKSKWIHQKQTMCMLGRTQPASQN